MLRVRSEMLLVVPWMLLLPAAASAYPYRYVPGRTSVRPSYYVPAPPPPPPAYVPPPRAVVVDPVVVPGPDAGLYLGIGGVGGILSGRPDGASFGNPGGGFELFSGVELSPWAALEFNWTVSSHAGDADRRAALHSLTLDALVFLTHSQGLFRPYVSFGGGAFLLSPDVKADRVLAGPGIDAGIGFDLRPLPMFSVGARLSWRGMYLGDGEALGAPARESAFLNDVIGTIRVGVHF